MKTINLLPKSRQQDLQYEGILHGLILLIWLSALSFVLVFLAQLGTKFYIEHQTQNIQSDITRLQGQINKQDNDKLKTQITGINNVISDYQTLIATSPKWSRVVNAFVKLPPSDVRINSFAANASTLAVTVSGFSPSRESVIQFYRNISDDTKHFTGVDFPLENVIPTDKINFHFEFNIQPDLIK